MEPSCGDSPGGNRPPPVLTRLYRGARARFAHAILWLLGWRFHTTHSVDLTREGPARFPKKWMTFGEPHTHLADFALMILFFWCYRLPPVRFPVAAEYFYPGFGAWMRFMGAFPVDTESSNGMVDQLVDLALRSDEIILHIPPSGTIQKSSRWHSGFYHIARRANLPIFPAYLDASTRTFGYGPPIMLTGDVKADMDVIRAFYADKRGLAPERESRIWLKEEGEPS